MFFYRHRICESHLNKYSRQIHARYLAGRTQKVATLNRLHVHKFFETQDKSWIYFVIDPKLAEQIPPHISKKTPSEVVLGFTSLATIPRWVALEVVILYVSPEARGRGIASLLYDSAMKDGVIIISGNRQNPKSRGLWLKMIKNPNYVTWAHDIRDLKRFSPIYIDEDGKLCCDLKIYEDIKKIRRRRREDIRIIAYNPRYV